jgi:hypothetical protein
LKRRLLVLALAGALTALTGLPICDAGPPDCPPCANWLIGAPFFGAIFAAWALVILRAFSLVNARRISP